MTETTPRREQTRLALIKASTRVFAAKGLGASVEELSEAAGFTRGAFYSNFSTKTELCIAVLEHYAQADLEAVSGALPAALESSSSLDELVAMAIDNFIELWGMDVDVLLSLHLIRLASARDEELRAAVLSLDARTLTQITPVIEAALADQGRVPDISTETMIMVLRSVYLGSLLDDYIAGNLDFELLRQRLVAVVKALVS